MIKKSITGVESKDGLSGAITDPGGIKETWQVPQLYSDPKTSGLAVEVKWGVKEVELSLKNP